MILIADRGNGRVTRDESSCMPKVYKELLKTGRYIYQDNTDNIPEGVDLIYLGIMYETMADVNLPVIIDSGDTEFFIKSKKVKRLLELGLIKKVITKLPSPLLDAYLLTYGITDIVHIPWGITPEKVTTEKDIDVSFLCTISKDYIFHRQREKIYGILQGMQRNSDLNIVIGSCFDAVYKEILQRSKVFIVEGSSRVSLTFKYLEGANAECLLVGDVPVIPDYAHSLYKDCMVEVTDWNLLPEVIEANINETQKQKHCKAMITEHFNFDKIVEMYKRELCEN